MQLSCPINTIRIKLICLFAAAFARGPTPQGCHFSTSLLHQCRRQRVESLMQKEPTTPLLTPTGWLPSSALINIQVLSEGYVPFFFFLIPHTHRVSKHLRQASYCQPSRKDQHRSVQKTSSGPGFVEGLLVLHQSKGMKAVQAGAACSSFTQKPSKEVKKRCQ